MWNNTLATELLTIKYPIIQGPFGGRFSSVKLVSTVSNLGGMGSFGLNSYAPDEMLVVDKAIKQATTKPYALNLWVPLVNDPIDHFKKKDFEKWKDEFKPYFDKMELPLPEFPQKKQRIFELQIESILRAKPPVASFIFGIPSPDILAALKKRGIITMATATTLEEALMIEEADVDIIIASGSEAGGHRASFIKPSEDSLTCTHLLVHQVTDNIKKPVIAAGGISNGKDINAMLKLGAAAVQLGTAFLATGESNAPDFHKERLLSNELIETNLSKVYTGRLARAISNSFSTEFNKVTGNFTAPYPIQGNLVGSLRKASIERGQLDYVAIWSGQPSSILSHRSSEELFSTLIKEVSNLDK